MPQLGLGVFSRNDDTAKMQLSMQSLTDIVSDAALVYANKKWLDWVYKV